MSGVGTSPAGDESLDGFADAVGPDGPVCVLGGATQWEVGGAVVDGTRTVRAPVGVRSFDPAEMTVRVGAGTTVHDLDRTLRDAGQWVALPDEPGATVGGVLAVGRSGIRRFGSGPVRDTLLEARVVGAHGRLVTAGGPTVKNVSGYDLCRLLVGSLGTLALLGEVVLRTRPRPEVSTWMCGETDPFRLATALHRPTSVLWDGERTWALIEGFAAAVTAQRAVASRLGVRDEVDGPPSLPPHRVSVAPAALREPALAWGAFVAEVGVGLVHVAERPVRSTPGPVVVDLHRRLKDRFDPTGRLNPGRSPLSVAT